MLAHKVLSMCGATSSEHPGEVRPHLYFYRGPKEVEKEEQAATGSTVTKKEFPALEFTATQPESQDRSEGVQVPCAYPAVPH